MTRRARPRILMRRVQHFERAAARAIKRECVADTWAPYVRSIAYKLPLQSQQREPAIYATDLYGAFAANDPRQMIGVVGTGGNLVKDLWVRAHWRSHGVGALLLRHAERLLARRGVRVARLETAPFAAQAIALYRRKGWRFEKYDGHRTSFYLRLRFAKRLR